MTSSRGPGSRRRRVRRAGARVPARSRLTVPRAVAALRRGRQALADIEGQLDALLATLRDGGRGVDPGIPDRLASARRDAAAALASLGAIAAIDGLLPARP